MNMVLTAAVQELLSLTTNTYFMVAGSAGGMCSEEVKEGRKEAKVAGWQEGRLLRLARM